MAHIEWHAMKWNRIYRWRSAIKYLFFFFVRWKIWTGFVVCSLGVVLNVAINSTHSRKQRLALWCLAAHRSYTVYFRFSPFFFFAFYWYSSDSCNVCTLLERVCAYDVAVICIENADKFLGCIWYEALFSWTNDIHNKLRILNWNKKKVLKRKIYSQYKLKRMRDFIIYLHFGILLINCIK